MNVHIRLDDDGPMGGHLIGTYHDVKSIVLDDGRYILSFGDNKEEDASIDALECTLTVFAE